MRFRSEAHHTEGFASRAEAQGYMSIQTKWKDTELVWEWDGTGIPTITADFAVDKFLSTTPTITER